MSDRFFPNAASEVVDPNRRATIPWRNWFASVNAALANGTITDADLTAAVAKILTSLGTTDGTADTIVDVAGLEINHILPIIVEGDVRNGFLIKLQDGAIQPPPIIGQHMLKRSGPRGRPGRAIKGDKGDKGDTGQSFVVRRPAKLARRLPVVPGPKGDPGDPGAVILMRSRMGPRRARAANIAGGLSSVSGSALADGYLWIGNSAGVATAVLLSGDVTVSDSGVMAIGAGKVTNTMLAGSIDLTTKVTGILPSANGGTANGFTKFSGPTTSEKTKTLRDASDTILELAGSYTPTGTWTSLTMVTPVLGTPTSGTLTNCTGLPAAGVVGTAAVITTANSMTAVSTPSAPSSGFLQNYSKTLSGREMPFVRGTSGIERCLEIPEITSWHGWFKGFGSAAGTYVGIAGTNTVTPVQTSPTNTNRFTLMHRSTYSSVVTTTNQQIGSRATFNTLFRGNAAGIGGFWVVVRFGFTTIKTSERCFVGLSANTNNVTYDPSGLTNIAGFGFDTGDTAWTFMHNDNSGTATKDAIGCQATLATNNTGFIAVIGCYPNDSKIYYALYDLVQGTWLCDTSTNTDLPVNTTALGVNVVMSNGTANTAANDAQLGISTIDVYTES